jgi:hypothetical protein
MKIWLDDCREAPDNTWFIARTIEVVKEQLELRRVTCLSLDNDLGLGEEEGYRLVTWMVETGLWPQHECLVHSRNSVAAQRMQEEIAQHFKPQGS